MNKILKLKRKLLVFSFVSTALITYGEDVMSKADLIKAAELDTLIPIRQGGVDNRPFWNTYAKQFIYVPSFEFKEISGAKSYRFTVKDRFSVKHSFIADSPKALLTPVWTKIPVGPVLVTVTALDANGKKIASAGERTFYRNAPFNDSYPEKDRPYDECAKKAYEYMYNFKYIQDLADKAPDLSYPLFCYPSKMHSAIITGMINYAAMVPEKKESAMKIALGAAKHLMNTAAPAGSPLEYLPRTYENNPAKASTGGENSIMMIYPAVVGGAMINLYNATGNRNYLDYAIRIGEQYLKLQQPNGSWYLILNISTGKPAAENYCMPIGIMSYLEKLSKTTGDNRYSKAAAKGIPYIRTMLATFNFEGQFEDVEAMTKPFINLTKHIALDAILYLASIDPDDPDVKKYAREMQRFAEDQFIVWEQPGWTWKYHVPGWRTLEGMKSRKWGNYNWNTPCVLEQYRCYVPVDASSAKLIQYFLFLYDREKNPLDLAKARALGDAVTRVQQRNGRIPTWFDANRPAEHDWINCCFATANTMKKLATYK